MNSVKKGMTEVHIKSIRKGEESALKEVQESDQKEGKKNKITSWKASLSQFGLL